MPSGSTNRQDDRSATEAAGGVDKATPYAYYALGLLVLANLFNYLDRHVIAVLSPAIQADLGLTDADMGFLLGTAFAVLYGVIGIPAGRIADTLSRTKLMAGGLALWSSMTALSGAAVSFATLGAARVGVGVGEATANPVSHSLLCDYFPARNRSAVLGCYLGSVHLGIGLSLVFGGLLLQYWGDWCSLFPGDACRLESWRAGFVMLGIPGLLLAVLILLLREPPRPEGTIKSQAGAVIRAEFASTLPPFTLFTLARTGGARAVRTNMLIAALVFGPCCAIAYATGDWAQWIAVAIGVYSVATWALLLRLRDRPLYNLTFGCRTFNYSMFAGAFIACFVGTIGVWAPPYALRTFDTAEGQIGIALGIAQLVAAGTSVVLGGFITDWWKRRDVQAPIWIGLIALLAPIPMLLWMLTTTSLTGFIAAFCFLTLFAMCWAGAFAALVQDLVLVRMRGVAAAIFAMVMILTASGLGPYWAGKVSTMTGSLTTGLYSLLVFVPIAVVLLLLAARRLAKETPERRMSLAREGGEPI